MARQHARTPEEYDDAEATKRMEDALRRALSTPHKPNKDFVGKKVPTKPKHAATKSSQ